MILLRAENLFSPFLHSHPVEREVHEVFKTVSRVAAIPTSGNNVIRDLKNCL